MNRSKVSWFFTLTVLALAFSSLASATTITSFNVSLISGDPTQSGRLSRNGVPQDWSGGEPYPGEINPTTLYRYKTFLISSASFDFGTGQFAGYVQIDVDSVPANTFTSAYLNSYNAASKSTNWLGDEGFSGNAFGTDPNFFQVLLNPGDDLVIVVNQTGTGTVGLNEGVTITVEGFVDSEFTDPTRAPQVPEPASMILLSTGVAARWLRRKFAKA